MGGFDFTDCKDESGPVGSLQSVSRIGSMACKSQPERDGLEPTNQAKASVGCKTGGEIVWEIHPVRRKNPTGCKDELARIQIVQANHTKTPVVCNT